MSTTKSDIFVAKMRDPLSGTTRYFVTAEALVGSWVEGDRSTTEPTRAPDGGVSFAEANDDVPNPYEEHRS